MKLLPMVMVSTCLMLLSACSTQSASEGSNVASTVKEEKICTKEKVRTGSSIRRKTCKPSKTSAKTE
ncbi:hypothetical protein [Colwellia piezophila]|uniref:hypothetical protein n=1 Tax=Colwellia piezophila TaxID=211668 RepID=UPI00037964B8|nr:hypothetical protein [Colwellia piezophila]